MYVKVSLKGTQLFGRHKEQNKDYFLILTHSQGCKIGLVIAAFHTASFSRWLSEVKDQCKGSGFLGMICQECPKHCIRWIIHINILLIVCYIVSQQFLQRVYPDRSINSLFRSQDWGHLKFEITQWSQTVLWEKCWFSVVLSVERSLFMSYLSLGCATFDCLTLASLQEILCLRWCWLSVLNAWKVFNLL